MISERMMPQNAMVADANGSQPTAHRESYELLPVRLVNFDYDHYQRPPQKRRVAEFAREWCDIKSRGIIVSRRADGSLWGVDGQHRILAAIERHGDGVQLWCIVIEGLTIEEEAAIFEAINRRRVAVHISHGVRALLTSKDPFWCSIMLLLDRMGVEHQWQGTVIRDRVLKCWSALERISQRGGIELLERTLRMTLAVWDGHRRSLEANVLLGMATFILRYEKDPRWSEKKVVNKLRLASFEDFSKKRGYYKSLDHSAIVAVSLALRDLYNSGKRTGQIGQVRRQSEELV